MARASTAPLNFQSLTLLKKAKNNQTQCMKCKLPIPPSCNHIFRVARRGKVYRSKKYVDWHKQAEVMIRTTVQGTVPQPPLAVVMKIIGGSGWRKDRDLDNAWKPVLDFLVHMRFLPEDNCQVITRLMVTYQPGSGRPAECLVSVTGTGE